MAQPEPDNEDGTPEAEGYVVLEAMPLAPLLAEYGTAAALFAGFVWVRDVPLGAVASLGTFAAVVLLANQLFNRLAGMQPMRFRRLQADGRPYGGFLSRWTTYSQAGLFGSIVAGIADLAHEYVAGIGVAGSALAGFAVALAFSGWRQRRRERRLYRETLVTT